MKKLISKFNLTLLTLCMGLLLASPMAILAVDEFGLETTAGPQGANIKTGTDLPQMAGAVVNYLFLVVGVIFMTVILIGGYLWMTAGGNEEKVGKAKHLIINGINGMIVIFLSYTLAYTILAALRAAVG